MAVVVTVEYRYAFVTGYDIGRLGIAHSLSLQLDLKALLGLQEFYSRLGQDQWIIGVLFPSVTDGFFVDVGAWDAEKSSNSKALEELGGSGICIDPFPQNWHGRRCELYREVVYCHAGETIRFRKAGGLGGIDEHLGLHERMVRASRSAGRPSAELTAIHRDECRP